MRSRLGYSSQHKEYPSIGPASYMAEFHVALGRFLLYMSSLNLFGSGVRGHILGDCQGACCRVLNNKKQYKEKLLLKLEHIKNQVD